MNSPVVRESAREVPVAATVDLCVVGGSCTGVFAAVRAARLGLRVALVEALNQFGGTATGRMVYVWHSLLDLTGRREIIGGLTREVMDRLARRGAVIVNDGRNADWQFRFNPAELACELDALIAEHPGLRPFLHARMVAAARDERGALTHILIEDKSGRRAIAARQFVDASGDADVLRRLDLPVRRPDHCQPPTMAGIFAGVETLKQRDPSFNLFRVLFDPGHPKALPPGFVWGGSLPGLPALSALFGTRVHGVNCADADDLTRAEMEGRRQLRQMVDLLRERGGDAAAVHLVALPAAIGIRETVHAICRHRLTESEVLQGVEFADRIAVGTYRVDIHHQGEGGLTFRYLDGREQTIYTDGRSEAGRWRPPQPVDPPFYQIPFRSLVPEGVPNLLMAGRHLDADAGAFGAIRVMVNCNQVGEAAGVAAAVAMDRGCDVGAVSVAEVQQRLRAGGSLLP